MNRLIWTRAALAIALIALVASIVGLSASLFWGWAAACLGLLFLLWRQLRNLGALARWLRDTEQAVPHGTGIWEETFSALYRMMRAVKRERQQLTAALSRFRAAGMAMPDGVVILDSLNHIEWCNPTAERLLGIDSTRDVRQPILNLVRAPDFAAYLGKGHFSEPLSLRLARAEAIVLSLRVIPYGHDQRLLLCRDVTQAERIEAMRRDFVANVSHELKTPLTVVNGFVETLADGKLKFSEPRMREVLALMQQQTGRMLRLVEDLLVLSALESNRNLAAEKIIPLAELLPALHAEAVALSGGRHRIEVDEGPAALLAGEEKDLRSAFGNLVSNAVRYTPEGGAVCLSWRIRPSGEGEFAVSDTGIGIASRHIPRLTERFYRVDHSRSRETGGTGLGLAIVKHVLNHHQASLEVESVPGKGSRFMAVFPARRVRLPDSPTAKGGERIAEKRA